MTVWHREIPVGADVRGVYVYTKHPPLKPIDVSVPLVQTATGAAMFSKACHLRAMVWWVNRFTRANEELYIL